MSLLQRISTPHGLGHRPLSSRRLVHVRYRDEDRTSSSYTSSSTGSPRTQLDSPYYSGYNDDPSESLREGWRKLKQRWDDWDPEKRNQTLAWGGGGLLVLYLANGLLNAVENLPILPQFLELTGFAFSSWFFFRYLLFAEGREDLSRLSLDKLLGRAAEEATQDFSRAAREGAEGIAEGSDRIRRSDAGRAAGDIGRDVGRAVRGDGSQGSGRLSDGSRAAYSRSELDSGVNSALKDIDNLADDLGGR